MKKDIISPHDKFFRSAMDDPRVAREFLEAHLPDIVKNKIDMTVLETCPETFVDEDLKLSQSDVVLKTSINQIFGLIYILVEHQSTIDHSMPLRLLKYMIKIWEHFQIQNGASSTLVYPVIVPLVFYTGKKEYNGKCAMWDLCGENAELMHTLLSNPFSLIDVNTVPDEELKKRLYSGTMEFVMRYQFRQHFDQQLLQIIGNLAQLTIDPKDNFLLKLLRYILIIDEKHDTVQSLLMTIHDNAPPSLRGNIMGLAEKIYHEGEEKGIEKGRIEAEKNTKVEIAKNMLDEGTDPVFVAKVTGLSLSFIKKIKP